MTMTIGSNASVSDEQIAAIMVGSSKPIHAQRIELPAGPHALPDWVKDAHISWANQYVNRPSVAVRMAYDPLYHRKDDPRQLRWYREEIGKEKHDRMPGKRYRYMGYNEDGTCFSCHYHNGPVALRQNDIGPKRDADGKVIRKEGGQAWECEREYEEVLMTTKQDGYGGRQFRIRMADDSDFHPGEEIVLWGPWHGGAPSGYVEVTGKIYDDRYDKNKPWEKWMGYFGYLIKEELFIDILATYFPECPLFLVDLGYAKYIEPGRAETQLPKGFMIPEAECSGHKFPDEHDYQRCLFCGVNQDVESLRARMPTSPWLPENRLGRG